MSSPDQAPLPLRLDGLIVGEGGFRLGPLSLEVRPGQVLAVVGPNGSGKSSLLRVLAGLRRPHGGQLSLPLTLAGSPGQTAAWLPPPGEVSTALDVLTVVAMGRASLRPWAPQLSAPDRQVAREALSERGLSALAERAFDTLSSGQRQLVLIARLSLQSTTLCLLDEPTALLDPAQALRVTGAVRGLADAGRIVVVATHDLSLAARADRALLLPDAEDAVGRPFEGAVDEALSAVRLQALFGTPAPGGPGGTGGRCPCCGRDHDDDTSRSQV